MEPDPFLVRLDDGLEEVVERMLAQRYDVAVVMDGDRMVGVFTHTDALEALLEVLRDVDVPALVARELHT